MDENPHKAPNDGSDLERLGRCLVVVVAGTFVVVVILYVVYVILDLHAPLHVSPG